MVSIDEMPKQKIRFTKDNNNNIHLFLLRSSILDLGIFMSWREYVDKTLWSLSIEKLSLGLSAYKYPAAVAWIVKKFALLNKTVNSSFICVI